MIYYKAICKLHGWESPGLYNTRAAAIRSARSHRSNTSGSHNVVILEVFIPSSNIEIRSEETI